MINHLPRGRTLLAAAAIALGSIDVVADNEIYECVDANGNVTYQDDPCPAETVQARPAQDPEPVSEPPPRVVKPAAKAHRMVPVTPPRPVPAVPAATPTPRAQPPAAAGLVVLPALPPPQAPAAPPPRRSHLPVDPRFASPERTWETFVNAMRSGDREAALTCLDATTREQFGAMVESSSVEALRALAAEYQRVEFEGEVGPFWSVRVLRANARPTWIFLHKTEDGAWKIAAI